MPTRREILRLGAAGVAGLAGSASGQPSRSRMGIGSASLSHVLRAARAAGDSPLTSTAGLLALSRELGGAGIQTTIAERDPKQLKQLRKTAEQWGMYLEASLRLPSDASELSEFRDGVEAARRAGVTVIRTYMLSGRRYEIFTSDEGFMDFARSAWKSLTLAEPVVRKREMKLAIENHKDWRSNELLNIIDRISSESVGICVDTGNNVALLEDPVSMSEAFAPHAYSVHLKDVAIEETEDGFLLSEVPLGEGMLNLKRIVQILGQSQPSLRFSLEMITRDPLSVPCLTKEYWATLPEVPGADLAAALTQARASRSGPPLPRVSQLAPEEVLRVEKENIRKSIAFAQANLGL